MAREATVADVVTRLLSSGYASTAEHALGWGMGEVERIGAAVDAAIAAGAVRVVAQRDTSYGRGVRFLALTHPARVVKTPAGVTRASLYCPCGAHGAFWTVEDAQSAVDAHVLSPVAVPA
jgi:hypothetical protein